MENCDFTELIFDSVEDDVEWHLYDDLSHQEKLEEYVALCVFSHKEEQLRQHPEKQLIRIFPDYGMGCWIWGKYPAQLCYKDDGGSTQLEEDGFKWSCRWEGASVSARMMGDSNESVLLNLPSPPNRSMKQLVENYASDSVEEEFKRHADATPPGWDWAEWNSEGEALAERVRAEVGDDFEVIYIGRYEF